MSKKSWNPVGFSELEAVAVDRAAWRKTNGHYITGNWLQLLKFVLFRTVFPKDWTKFSITTTPQLTRLRLMTYIGAYNAYLTQ